MSFSTSSPASSNLALPQAILDRQSDQLLLADAKAAFSSVAPNLDTTEGSFAHDLLAAFCVLLAQAYVDMADIERRTSLATATGADLDRLGDLYGVPRTPAGAATLSALTFSGAVGSVIPLGTIASTAGPNAQVFSTTLSAVIPLAGSVAVPAVALTAGAAGNVAAGTVVVLGAPVPVGVTSVTNVDAGANGSDQQVDGPTGQYLTGYRADIRALSDARGEGGAAKHLRKWARAVAGVGAVRVIEATPTPGWVTVALVGTDSLPASQSLVLAVEDFLLDPRRVSEEAETLTRGGFGATLDTQSDGLPVGGSANTVKLVYNVSGQGTLVHTNVQSALVQPGIWRFRPRMKVATPGTGNLVQFGLWDLTANAWAKTRPSGTIDANIILTAAQLTSTFADYEVEATIDGVRAYEFRLYRLITDTTSTLWVDQVNYWATMSRDDRDLGLTPAGMRLLVEPAGAVTINVAATLTYGLQAGQTTATVQADLHTRLVAYLAGLVFLDNNDVRRAAVEDVIYNTPGIADVNNVLLNGSANNVAVGPTQVGVLGSETWS